jgi:hypothetical protein
MPTSGQLGGNNFDSQFSNNFQWINFQLIN